MVKLTEVELARQTLYISEPIFDYVSIQYLIENYSLDATISYEIDSGYYDSECTLKVNYTREENDKEYQSRIDKLKKKKALDAENARKSKAKKESQERKEYERLKAKFEGK